MLGRGIGQAIAPGVNPGYAHVSKDQTDDYGNSSLFELPKRAGFRLIGPNRFAAPRASMVNIENYTGVFYQKQLAPLAAGRQNQNRLLNRIRSSYAHILPKPGS